MSVRQTPLAGLLAERILAVRDLPEEVTAAAREAILDTVGVMLAGASEAPVRIAASLHASCISEGSVLFGSGRRAHMLSAAEINGIAAHVLDFDCVAETMAGHPTVQVVPALLALGETLDCSGADFVAAFVAGLETQARIARGIAPLGRAGWFSTSVLGTLGTAAACSRLLQLGVEPTARALAIAATLASGILANAASGAKSLAAGHAARNGLYAALLARDGMTAAADALEHRQGFLAAFNAIGRSDLEAMLTGWGAPFDIVEPGVWIKQYPCCGIAHAPVDLMLEFLAERKLTAEHIAGIEVLLHPQRIGHVDRPQPQTGTMAAFSIQYCLARTVMTGPPVLADFQGDAFRDPALAGLMQRVHVAADPRTDPASINYGEQFGARLSVTSDGGERWEAAIPAPRGLGRGNRLGEAAVEAKFKSCAERSLQPGAATRLYDALRRIEHVHGLRGLAAIGLEQA